MGGVYVHVCVGIYIYIYIYMCMAFGLVLWYINPCRLFNVTSILYVKQFYFKQFSLALVHSLYVKKTTVLCETVQFSISIVLCLHTVKFQNSYFTSNLVKHKYSFFCLHTVKYKNSSIPNNSV